MNTIERYLQAQSRTLLFLSTKREDQAYADSAGTATCSLVPSAAWVRIQDELKRLALERSTASQLFSQHDLH